ncbi:MAG: hypothetical protein OHK0029_02510 [Armatimonadaceae bacterium]
MENTHRSDPSPASPPADPSPLVPPGVEYSTSRLSTTIRAATQRVRFLRARHSGAGGILLGAALSGGVLLLERFRLLEAGMFAPEWLLLPPLTGLTLGILWGATRPVPPLDLLRYLETRLDLKERLSTALLLENSPASQNDPFVQRQRADAEAHSASPEELQKALPYLPVPRRVPIALASVGAVFLLWYLPTLTVFQTPAQRAEKAVLKRDGERLIQIAKKVAQEADTKNLDAAKKAAAKLAKLGEEMKRGRLNQQKAMMQAAKLTEELKQAQQTLAQQSGNKSLARAAGEMRQAMAAAQAMSGQKQEGANKANATDALKTPQGQEGKSENPKSGSEVQQAMNRSVAAMQQENAPSLAEQLSKMADLATAGKPETSSERQEFAQQLDALAKSLENTAYQEASSSLAEAAEAMQSGDMARASEKLREAARKVAEAAKNSEAANAMQQMASALSNGQSGEASEGAGFSDAGEGSGESDSFGENGLLKEGDQHVHTAECLEPGGT